MHVSSSEEEKHRGDTNTMRDHKRSSEMSPQRKTRDISTNSRRHNRTRTQHTLTHTSSQQDEQPASFTTSGLKTPSHTHTHTPALIKHGSG